MRTAITSSVALVVIHPFAHKMLVRVPPIDAPT
jgi:hypothetical protein